MPLHLQRFHTMNPVDISLLITAFIAIICTALGLECHVCNSMAKDEEACADMADLRSADFTKECRDTSMTCMKQTTKNYVLDHDKGDSVEGLTMVTRFCGMDDWEGCFEQDGARSLTTQCSCKGTRCNTASQVAAISILSMGSALLIALRVL